MKEHENAETVRTSFHWKKERALASLNGMALSLIGAGVAGYHYLLQIGVAPALNCAAVGYSVDCAQRFVMQFGYVTIPMMALTAFLLMAVLLSLALGHNTIKDNGLRA